MGLTNNSTGSSANAFDLDIKKTSPNDVVVALAGNPNVGKSTVFNSLTGLKQHTGNWPGKTVGNAQGHYTYSGKTYTLVDIPGAYSLSAHSAEEEIARDFICFGGSDVTVVVCDATCLLRNLNLVLQTLEITNKVVVCVNLMDEAKRKKIEINCKKLSKELGVPVVATSAREGKGLKILTEAISRVAAANALPKGCWVVYQPEIEEAIDMVMSSLKNLKAHINLRWLSLQLLDLDESLRHALISHLGQDLMAIPKIADAIKKAKEHLAANGFDEVRLRDAVVADIYKKAEAICKEAVLYLDTEYNRRQLKIDRLVTGKATGIPIMILLLLFVLWLTITGANYPSALLSSALFKLQDYLLAGFAAVDVPAWLYEPLVLGVYRVLAWVVSVMLPPMAIFFPLFTLLEDLGYLPRVAFNLDACFKKCHACGKQALTMCMGFGCNAAGVVGCRIIDSPRERTIAILTNCFVPCNGRFPGLIAIITMFFVAKTTGIVATVWATLCLAFVILLGIGMTFFASFVLSKTLFKGIPSAFTLELPPYRRPQIGKVIVRSVFDRTLFVLGRAVAMAAPAGLVIYVMANLQIGGLSLLAHCADFLDPFARLLGLDGVILMAFILGFPANEIVIPIAVMAYMSTGVITEMESLNSLQMVLRAQGWTWLTAACTIIFSMFHWPCSTTLISIKKETGSFFLTAVGFLLPTLVGMLLCFLLRSFVHIFMGL
ncbi:MAG: ferrous iron transport protein B [Clostridia bacterium]|nr:ferrous iron transport protein B [Clostridia bacterium]